jgi:parallel beta-helix repeat protein
VVDAMQNGNPAIQLQSDGNALERFIATNTTDGVAGVYIASNNNIIKSTTAHSNGIGIKIASGASNNTLYENILYNNTNVSAVDENGSNAWNSSSLGNYYDTIAVHDSDSNGINDSSYLISGNASSIDYFPLVIASKAVSPATASGTGSVTFSINTSIIGHAHVGVSTMGIPNK